MPPSAPKKIAGKDATGTKVQEFFLQKFFTGIFYKKRQILFSAVKLKIIGTRQKVLPRIISSHLQTFLRIL